MELKFAIVEKPLFGKHEWEITYHDNLYFFYNESLPVWDDNPESGTTANRKGDPCHILQYIGLQDIDGQDWYHMDIGEFPNGDRFTIKREDWLECYVDWIGDPKCEDQARDFYRIHKAKKIGNHYTWKGDK